MLPSELKPECESTVTSTHHNQNVSKKIFVPGNVLTQTHMLLENQFQWPVTVQLVSASQPTCHMVPGERMTSPSKRCPDQPQRTSSFSPNAL